MSDIACVLTEISEKDERVQQMYKQLEAKNIELQRHKAIADEAKVRIDLFRNNF